MGLYLSVAVDTVTGHEQRSAAPWATTAGNKFREVASTTENPTTKLLAEGLTPLTEAIRELDDKLEKVEPHVRSSTTEQ
jgi:hypothetical protein